MRFQHSGWKQILSHSNLTPACFITNISNSQSFVLHLHGWDKYNRLAHSPPCSLIFIDTNILVPNSCTPFIWGESESALAPYFRTKCFRFSCALLLPSTGKWTIKKSTHVIMFYCSITQTQKTKTQVKDWNAVLFFKKYILINLQNHLYKHYTTSKYSVDRLTSV